MNGQLCVHHQAFNRHLQGILVQLVQGTQGVRRYGSEKSNRNGVRLALKLYGCFTEAKGLSKSCLNTKQLCFLEIPCSWI